MLFLFPPKMNDDFVFQDNSNVMEVEAGAITGSLTWAAIKAAAVAAGSALAPVAVGAVGAAAIGWVVDETIGWDVIADYGQGIIDSVTGRGGTVEDIYDAETETVRLTQEFVGATAAAVDTLPNSLIIDYGVWTALPAVTVGAKYEHQAAYDVAIPSYQKRSKLIIRGDFTGNAGYYSSGFTPRFHIMVGGQRYFGTDLEMNKLAGGRISSGAFEVVSYPIEYTGSIERIELKFTNDRGAFLTLENVRATIVVDDVIPKDVTVEDLTGVKESVGATIEERNTYITNVIGDVGAIPLVDSQAVTGVTFAEMAAATTAEDLDDTTANDLGVLGTLALIYNYVKSLPVRIAGSLTSLFDDVINAILAVPGAITGVLDDLLIDVNSLGNAIAGSIDDLLIDVNALGNSLWGSLDELLIDVNALGNSLWGSLDELLIDVNSLANSLAGSFGGLLINLGTWFDSLINGIGSITGSVTGAIADAMAGLKSWLGLGLDTIIGLLNDIWSWITGLAQWLLALIVPTSLAVLQPSITSLTSTFNDKFAFIVVPIKNFGNAYNQSKSLYDVTFKLKYKDVVKDVHVLPIAYKPAVDVFRLVANGVVVVLTYISMYNRFRKEVLTG